mmetsp:Transcript_37704/g.82620  ORF Transcript_37704/g.82620 Transcript_37704/m.82620 type:complete len:288 (-) Transcript_37704:66-929(-)
MVLKVNSPANNNATIDAASFRHSIKDASADDMAEKITMVTEYFACLNGKPDAWERFEPMLRRTVHPDVVVETNTGDMGYDDLAALVRDKYIPNGCIAELVSVHDNGDGTLTNTVNNHLPGEDGDTTLQKVYFKDGKVIRVTSTVEFGVMLDRVSALEVPSTLPDIGDVAALYREFLQSIDGSSNGSKLTGFDEVFDEKFTFVTEDGNKDVSFFKSYVEKIASDGQLVRIDDVEVVDSDKIRVKFDVGKRGHFVKVDRIKTVKNGKIVRSEPVASTDGDSFTKVYVKK